MTERRYLTSTVVTAARASLVGSMATGRRSRPRRRRAPPAPAPAPPPPAPAPVPLPPAMEPLSTTRTTANGRFAICSI